ncbi:uncharacterized protein LOC125790044 isoform X2 [Astyanax mexicanus]|nr:uncharacterized protein LOC125790044 isoform X2 [Astyanax mexicanus]
MENIWIKGVRRKLKKVTDPDVIQEVVVFDEQWDFMKSYIKKLEDETQSYFKSPVCTHKNYYYYACERSSKPTGKSKGKPTQTRANSCGAYVSFRIIRDAAFTGAVVNKMLKHHGHDVDIQEEGVKNPVDPELLGFIEMWLEQGLSVSETLLKSVDWAERHGHVDKHNRRYYVTPEDIRTIKKSINALFFPDVNDSVSVDILATSELKENISFYQPLSEENPLIIVVQTPWQKELLKLHPHPMMFMDATYKSITSYGYAFYALLLSNSIGRGVPFAYFIVSEESAATLSLCLEKLSSSNPGFYPRSVMVDKDLKELKAIAQVFPSAKVLICWFHVLQAVHRWLVKRDGGNLPVDQRNMVIQAMAAMKVCLTEEEFINTADVKCKELDSYLGSSHVTAYLKPQWISCGQLWSNFGRSFSHENSETNNKAERFFLTIKYQFLKGNTNRRIDQLLRLLCGDLQKYYCYMEDLAEIGRIKGANTEDFSNAVKSMIEKGLDSKCTINENGTCVVPPDTGAQNNTVDLVMVKCDCRRSKSGAMCKHIVFSKTVAQQQGIDIQDIRNSVAKKIISSHSYFSDEETLTVFHSDGSSGTINHRSSNLCTCVANSYGEKCVCVLVRSILFLAQTPCELISNDPVCHKTPMIKSKADLQTMLTDLIKWSQSDKYTKNEELYKTVERAHKLVFSNFCSLSRKRRTTALHAYRQRIKKAQKAVTMNYICKRKSRGKKKKIVKLS